MAFFLFGRAADGTVSLLSEVTFESRQSALAELGRMTGDPTFDRWDDEVVLIDLDAGTPVLLVRPTAPVAEQVAEPLAERVVAPSVAEREPEPAAFAAMADTEPAPVPVATSLEPEVAEPRSAEVREPQWPGVVTPPEDAVGPDIMPEIVPDIVPELLPEPVELAAAAPVVDATEVEGLDSLREAIARTTEHMHASGIVAPASIGRAEEPAADAEELAAEPVAYEAAVPVVPATAEQVPAIPEPSAPAWPWATEPEPPAAADDSADESEADVAFVLEGLEEPAFDVGADLITGTIDDESLAASRPVILGVYDDDDLLNELSAVAGEPEPAETPEASAAAPDEIVIPGKDSDFFVLNPIPASLVIEPQPAPASTDAAETVEAPLAQPVDTGDIPSLSDYTCNDCVYVDTCPNKDERRPEDCGSFQWK